GQNLLLGAQQIKSFNSAELIGKALPLLLILLLVLIQSRGPEAMFSATLAGLMVSCFYVFWRLFQNVPWPPKVSTALIRKNFGYAGRAYLAGLFCFMVVRSDLFLVQKFSGLTAAGYYSIAVTLGDTLSLLPISVGMILFPRLSEPGEFSAKLRLTLRASAT